MGKETIFLINDRLKVSRFEGFVSSAQDTPQTSHQSCESFPFDAKIRTLLGYLQYQRSAQPMNRSLVNLSPILPWPNIDGAFSFHACQAENWENGSA